MLENEVKQLAESCKVFEVQISEYKQLKQCRTELRLLKCLWDYVFMVKMMFSFWKEILWNDIDVEQVYVLIKN